MRFPLLRAGAIIIETLLTPSGLGRLNFQAIARRDLAFAFPALPSASLITAIPAMTGDVPGLATTFCMFGRVPLGDGLRNLTDPRVRRAMGAVLDPRER